jgi:hypothetical protein
MSLKTVTNQLVYLSLALGLVIYTTTAWSTDTASVPQATTTKESVPLVDNRLVAIGLGTLGGIAAYSFLNSSWGMGTGMRIARAGLPGTTAAFRTGSIVWGSRSILSAVSGLIGALVGDWIYRSNQEAATP